MKILLVDADENIRNLMKEIIWEADCGWEVTAEAENAKTALCMLEEHPNVKLVIADISGLEMDGIDFIKKIRECYLKVKIIVVSRMSDYDSVRNAFRNGVKDYLLKPIRREELLAQIQNVQGCILKDEEDERNSQRSRNLFVASVMQQLLHGKGELEKKDIQVLEELGINTKFPCFFSIIVRADQYFTRYRVDGQYERKLDRDASVILHELERKNKFDYCFYINGHEIILLLFCDSKEQGEGIASKIFKALNTNSGELNTDSLGISNVHYELDEIRIAYREAEDAIQARFYLGPNKCVHYEDIKEKYIEMQYDLEPMVKQLVHYMELCDYIKSKQIMEQLFLDLSYSKPDKFRKCLHTLIEMLVVRIKNLDNALFSLAPDYQFQLDYLNTYRELKSYMNSILQGAVEYIKSEREKRSKKRIELAKIYIEENCQNKITLNDVAEYVELNTSYFSNLFKAEVGMNFTDYLLNIRVEKAKMLLKDPKIKVYEIGNLVGYEDAVSFGRAFKKKLGMSPKEYRNTVY